MEIHDLGSLKISLKVVLLLLTLLAISVSLNVCLFFAVIGAPRGEAEAGTSWIYSNVGDRMIILAIKLARDRVFYSTNEQFNVSVTASCWAPFSSGTGVLYFKLYDKRIYYQGSFDGSPKLLEEKTLIVNKTQAEMYYEVPVFNFTITPDRWESGTHLYSIVVATQPNVSLDNWRSMAAFAVNFGGGI